jgi:hypothetical protein
MVEEENLVEKIDNPIQNMVEEEKYPENPVRTSHI